MGRRDLSNQTIAAIATAPGRGGVSIVRLSGPEAIAVADRIFSAPLGNLPGHSLRVGRLLDGDTVVDEAVVLLMRSPKSYTREDVVELQCHGGGTTAAAVLGLCLKNGARLAEPGEFTKRAFLNGRIDLTQAEAVADLVAAPTELSREAALEQLQGALGQKVRALREEILDLTAMLEAAIDYPEETTELETKQELVTQLPALLAELQKLIDEAGDGQILRDGLSVAILGKPNVGKSSLLNCLLQTERAIVTDIPGTTRDSLEESVSIGGIPLRLIDTAGVRETGDVVERIGVDRALSAAREAQLVLLVLDGSRPLTEEDTQLLALTRERPGMILVNKADLPPVWERLPEENTKVIHKISVRTGAGVENLKKALRDFVLGGRTALPRVTNPRHKAALLAAEAALSQGLASVQNGLPEDMVSFDLQEALSALGEITGETASEELIDRIFEKFCLGK